MYLNQFNLFITYILTSLLKLYFIFCVYYLFSFIRYYLMISIIISLIEYQSLYNSRSLTFTEKRKYIFKILNLYIILLLVQLLIWYTLILGIELILSSIKSLILYIKYTFFVKL